MLRYLNEPCCKVDALVWWKQKESMFPLLSQLAKKFLCMPASSVPSERIFSTAGHIVNKKRACLSAENVNMLISLNKNSGKLWSLYRTNFWDRQTDGQTDGQTEKFKTISRRFTGDNIAAVRFHYVVLLQYQGGVQHIKYTLLQLKTLGHIRNIHVKTFVMLWYDSNNSTFPVKK